MNKEAKKEILVDYDRSGVEDSKCPLIATYKMQKCNEWVKCMISHAIV